MAQQKVNYDEIDSEINKPLIWNLKKEQQHLNLDYLPQQKLGNEKQYGCFDSRQLVAKVGEKGLLIDEYNNNKDCGVKKLVSNEKTFPIETTSCNCLSRLLPFNSSSSKRNLKIGTTMNKLTKFGGILLIVLLCLVCIYETWNWRKENLYKTRIKMVNVISRHGDRAPADGFQSNDAHQDKTENYWPNGLHNITDVGKYRMFRIGLKLRELYKNYLGFNSSEILALSSEVYRCRNSLEETLRGLYNVEFSRYFNLKLLKKHQQCLEIPKRGSKNNEIEKMKKLCHLFKSNNDFAIANEWKNINIRTDVVPTLSWRYLDNCPWLLKNPFKVDKDAFLVPNIAKLKGIKRLEKTLIDNYQVANLNYTLTHIWSTILAELNVFRTQTTYNDTSHFIHWINKKAKDEDDQEDEEDEHDKHYDYSDDDEEEEEEDDDDDDEITLYDLLEEATVQIYNYRIKGRPALIQNGPIITSLVDSYLVAMKQFDRIHNKNSINYYKDKKLIIYSTHDSIVINILSALDLIDFGSRDIFMKNMPYESRFKKYNNDKSDVIKLLNGIRMPAFGASLKFELIELESLDYFDDNGRGELFYYVQLSIYNQEDGKYGDIKYERVPLGTVCQRRYIHLYPGSDKIHRFYNSKFQFDKRFGCPFELFRNLTSDFLISQEKLEQACNDV